MKFIQIIEFQTTRMDEMDALDEKWQRETEGVRTLLRGTKVRDRDRPNTYMMIAEFDSYDDAMKNNDLPATNAIAAEMMKLADGEPTFRNLDVLDIIT